MRKIRLAFIGAGFMGQRAHLRNYAVLDDCEIVALAEARPLLAQKVARAFDIPGVYTDHMEMLSTVRPDAVVASQPFANHINLVPDVLASGAHLLTEKPLCISPENGKKLAALSHSKQLIHMVGYHKRSDPAIEHARSVIQEWKSTGSHGKMRLIRITMPPGDWIGGNPKNIDTTEPSPTLSLEEGLPGYGKEISDAYVSFVNYYIHQINMLRHLLGEPYKVTFADKSGVLLVAESASGICGTIEMAPYGTTVDWQEQILVGFEKGYISVKLPAPLMMQQAGQVTIFSDRHGTPTISQPILNNVSAMQNQASNFLRAVRGEIAPPCDAHEALLDLESAVAYIKLMNHPGRTSD